MTTNMLAAALAYASIGWPVFPCRPQGKEPLGGLVANGVKNATTDPKIITEWWARCPMANVAVACGAPGPDVLDVDSKDGRTGMDLFERARRVGLLRGAGAIVRTPSGGLHLWFEGTGQPGGAIGPKRALELKATGGYVLVPPSYVVSAEHGYAGHYELTERRDEAGTIDFAAIRRYLDSPPRRPVARPGRRSDVGALAEWVARQGEGNRNAALYWAACRAVETGATDLLALVAAGVDAGLSQTEAERTVRSAARKGVNVR